ncbi:RNA-binding S4 domain-containing protein [Striga asiatica]|uniref:RNA-binding S4 domain-containing protein n=1 Tax=Striga asiatica TaxID=4170 RepID=A0A5A7RAU0_STRAF|nr:RNA-binding S4 domain-containing protein [Striga asiatica]
MAATGLASQAFVRTGVHSFLQPAYRSTSLRTKLSGLRILPLSAPFTSSALGICTPVTAVKGGAPVLVKGVGNKDTIEDVKRILDMANRASLRQEVLHTDFLTPLVLKESMQALEKFTQIKMVVQGGYPEAERCRLSVGHPDILTSDPDIIAALSISGNFSFESCSHGDFLGAILGTGIVRDKLGDIILQGEKGAHILIVPELVDFLVSSLDKNRATYSKDVHDMAIAENCFMVRSVSVTCEKIPLLALEYQPPRTKTMKTVEASIRLDSIASAGFKISRSKMADLISKGDVRVNWATVMKNNTTLRTGDIISVSGKGRLKIGEISSTRKGKFAVELVRYL